MEIVRLRVYTTRRRDDPAVMLAVSRATTTHDGCVATLARTGKRGGVGCLEDDRVVEAYGRDNLNETACDC